MTEPSLKSGRVRLRRRHDRGAYDRASLYAVLDAMPLCHVGYVVDGQPYVTPTLQWREGDRIYWHGSAASRMLRATDGVQVCLTVSLLDGFVMARSGFHHSINYRSAMLLGKAEKVTDKDAKVRHMQRFVDGLFPGRWDMLRPATPKEMKATAIHGMDIAEASVKVRAGPPGDDEEDYSLPIWAGVIPLALQTLSLAPDPRNLPGVAAPDHLTRFKIG